MTRQLYLRPTAFVDAPFGFDGQVLRLAGGLCWFSAVELIIVEQGRRSIERLVPVERLDTELAALGLAEQGRTLLGRITGVRAPLVLGDRTLRFDQPIIAGILNITPDSFSDGGKTVDEAAAIEAGFAMASAGAAIVDVGGESTRPGAPLVWEGDEVKRVENVVAALARGGTAVSIDTRKAAVMEAALAAGATIVNDISALRYDDRATEVVARAGCAVVLMHAPSAKSDPHEGGTYAHVLFDVYDMLAERVADCIAAGIDPAKIIVDPGIGFGKGVADNLALINGLALFHTLGCPLLFGASRKRLIGALDNEASADQRLGGTVALHYQAATQGAQLLRVHDVAENRQALRVWRGLRDAALTA